MSALVPDRRLPWRRSSGAPVVTEEVARTIPIYYHL